MKTHTTKKDLNRFKEIIAIDYALYNEHFSKKIPTYYNAGVYGWNYDVWIINGFALIYGDRNCKTSKTLTLDTYDTWLSENVL